MRRGQIAGCVAVGAMLTAGMHAQAAGVLDADDPMAACGDGNVSFSVSRGPVTQHLAPPPEGKATVYIVEIYNLLDKGRVNRPTIREGLDGSWLGATQGLTYLSAQVAPGRHHLCSRWQSHFSGLDKQVSLNDFDAVAGQQYFFRVQINVEGGASGGGTESIDLEPVSEDEGRFLVTEAAPSLSQRK